MASYDDVGDDKAEWTIKNEGIFIRILHEHVKKGHLQTSTFSKKTWATIDDELCAETNRRYTVPQLKSKFNRLRKKYREFTSLINHPGFKWDPNSNTVSASSDTWEEYIKRVPTVKAYRKKGLEHYYILGEIFNSPTATGQIYLSSRVPANSDENREVEEHFFNSGVHVNLSEDVGETEPPVESKGKRIRRFLNQSPSDHQLKSVWERMENYLELCTEVMTRKLEKQKLKMQKSHTNQYSIEECLQIVEAMGIDNDTYRKFVGKIVDPEWRRAFLYMSDDRRRGWLARLK